MLTAYRSGLTPLYTPAPPRTPPSRPASPSFSLPRRPPSPVRPPSPSASPPLYRPPFRRNSLSAQPGTPSYSPPRPARPPSPAPRLRSTSPSGARAPSSAALHVYGDSFSSVFTLLGKKATVVKYKGASARGLSNPNSTLGVGPDLLARLEASRPPSALLMFGHVDLHVNYLWQLKAKGSSARSPSEWVRKVAEEYAAFLRNKISPLAQRTGTSIYVAGVTPPVVEDRYLEQASQKYLEKEGVGPLPPLSRASFPSDLTTRSMMVKRFNSLISAFCSRHSTLTFVDISPQIASSSDPRRVSSRFVDRLDPCNIHVVWETTIGFWCAALPPLRGAAPQDYGRLESSLEAWRSEKRERMKHRPLSHILVV
ncbi:hypothetical protein JCM10213v2_000450 [Rhodosporidiobolus nylandii]